MPYNYIYDIFEENERPNILSDAGFYLLYYTTAHGEKKGFMLS